MNSVNDHRIRLILYISCRTFFCFIAGQIAPSSRIFVLEDVVIKFHNFRWFIRWKTIIGTDCENLRVNLTVISATNLQIIQKYLGLITFIVTQPNLGRCLNLIPILSNQVWKSNFQRLELVPHIQTTKSWFLMSKSKYYYES